MKIFVRHGILGSMEDLRKNDIFEAEIVGYSSDGSGVSRINGRAVFVPRTIVGEVWQVKIRPSGARPTANIVFAAAAAPCGT